MTQAYRVEGCTNCINQCNTDNVGLAIEFCQAGSVIPDMGQGSAPVKTADPKPASSNPSRPIPTTSKAVTSKPAQETSPAKPSSQLTASSPPSAVANLVPTPATTAKHCSRARRRARRAHKRAMLANAHAVSI
ncbi:hypothetical protein EXIGLDRAFT_728108 [Exidia glandulosa HHB12029]|uniref:Uncharacterized protein n=1 Tax=Exidia glandulosa HHB12029 TaxID=1314781 RepID=A0A165ZVF9_EXIGL|nr:hypothetical protein EXIGLDRAFT_725271 [Exidia glandulosa HHB12029]KZV98374.1 hypothetical protein EXIGLDRAFT_728108 [Exidia glandulosa HHB12029]